MPGQTARFDWQKHLQLPHTGYIGCGLSQGTFGLEAEVDSKGLVEFVDKRWWQSADSLAYPLDSYRPDLFRLRF